MRQYVVIDTNVLVSALLKWSSIPGKILELAISGVLTPILNEKIVAEYREVLLREKFHLTKEIVNDVIFALEAQGEYISTENLNYDMPDSKDIIFYAVVMEKRKEEDTYLITGNIRHFPEVQYVVTPKEMLELLFV